jgi:hypothetical protein
VLISHGGPGGIKLFAFPEGKKLDRRMYQGGGLGVLLKVHVSVGICPMLKGQCLHALYVDSVHVSDRHQNKYTSKYIYDMYTIIPIPGASTSKYGGGGGARQGYLSYPATITLSITKFRAYRLVLTLFSFMMNFDTHSTDWSWTP